MPPSLSLSPSPLLPSPTHSDPLGSDKPTGRLALCFELMDMNIYELIRNRKTYVQESRIKLIMFQVLKVKHNKQTNTPLKSYEDGDD